VHDFAAAALLGRVETEGPGRPPPDHVARFRRRFQQLTGPVMAKSLEDTLFYRYARLISLNEVGGDPGHFGTSLAEFHKANQERMRSWPSAMIATATHDTKRGEDARARLNALSEMPDVWREALERWREVAEPHLGKADGAVAPDPNDQYMLLQSLLGAFPLELLDRDDAEQLESFRTRFHGYVEKALREAKRHSSWVNPNEAYEKAAMALVDACLAPGSAFLAAFRPLLKRLSVAGMVNGLGRTVLKCTLPGVPDTYQGTGFWDFSLVDPDNRRPVDYPARAAALARGGSAEALLESWPDGAIKQHVLARLLSDRAAAPELYAQGSYEPLGEREPNASVLAFRRKLGGEELVVAVARLATGIAGAEGLPVGAAWGEAAIRLPQGRWRSLLDDRDVEIGADGLAARELFAVLPVSVLRRTE
jgi:(1->4)-alpha-D-glucan 1-alpha-D-glucosylmutase